MWTAPSTGGNEAPFDCKLCDDAPVFDSFSPVLNALMKSASRGWSLPPVLKWFAKLSVAGVLFTLIFRQVPLEQVTTSLADIQPLPLVAALLGTLLVRLVSAVQFKSLTDAQGMDISLGRIFYINFVTAFYQLVLPGYIAGGAIRWYKLADGAGNADKAMSVILVSRLFDIMVAAVWMLIMFTVDTSIRAHGYPATLLFFTGASLALAFSYFCVKYQQRLGAVLQRRWFGGEDQRSGKIARALNRLIRLLLNFGRPGDAQLMWAAALLSLYHCLAALTWFFLAMGLGIDIPYLSMLWIRIVVYLAVFIPLSLSGLGVREGLLIMLLAPLGISSGSALALALSLLGLSIAIGLLGGIVEAFVLTFGMAVGRPRKPAN
jgi:uncharacterized protein (TIRG00374 family)